MLTEPPAVAALQEEHAALLRERDGALRALGRAEARSEQATAAVEAARRTYDAAIEHAKEAAAGVVTARRALAGHEAATREGRGELAPLFDAEFGTVRTQR